ARFCLENEHGPLPENPAAEIAAELDRILVANEGEHAGRLREELQDTMMDNVGIFRNGPDMQTALEKVRELKQRYARVVVMDKGRRFNTDLLEAWELKNLLDLAEVVAVSGIKRTESRGAHAREDF